MSVPSAISGRDLANEAGVNYGLVHRHFGSKWAVLDQALNELLDEYRADAIDPIGPPRPLALADHPAMWRAFVNVTLDSASFDQFRSRVGTLAQPLAAVRSSRPELDDDQAKAIVALGLATEFGIAINWSTLRGSVGVDPDEPIVCEFLVAWLAGLYAGHGPLGLPPGRPAERPRAAQVPELDRVVAGRSDVEERLVRAGADLLADRAPSAITGRGLARLAGVNYGLIHHYFGSKDDVLKASMQMHRDRFFAAHANFHHNPRFFSLCDHPGYVRAIVRAEIAPEFAGAEQRYPVMDRMLTTLLAHERHSGTGPELETAIRLAVFTVTSAQVAWAFLLPVFEERLGTDPRRLEPVVEPLLRELLLAPTRDVQVRV